jgi:hypothetical protein
MGEPNEPRADQPAAEQPATAGSVVDVVTTTAAEAAKGGFTAAQIALRSLGYTWALPNSVLGLCFVPLTLASGGRARWERGAIEVHGGAAKWFLEKVCGGVCAMTLGHVILAVDKAALDHCRNHEHVHVEQYMRWGPLFLPMYGWSSFQCKRQGKNPYLENRFEIEAYGKFPV